MRKWIIAAMALAGLFAGLPSYAVASTTKAASGHVHSTKTHSGKHGKKGHHKGHKGHKGNKGHKGHKKSTAAHA